MFHKDGFCPRCARKIDSTKSTWLECDFTTGTFHENGTVNAENSQGCFEFGSDCAKAILKNDGKVVLVGQAKRIMEHR